LQSYDYTHRKGVRIITWDDFGSLAKRLVESLARYSPEIVIGIARAGLFPGTAVACMLRCEYYPVRLTRRVDDEVVYGRPVWKVPLPAVAKGKTVAVVDEIADSGETLAMAAEAVRQQGAKQVVTACLVSHTWAEPSPDVAALLSDELVIFPWDRDVYMNGGWQPHPEIEAALNAQGKSNLESGDE